MDPLAQQGAALHDQLLAKLNATFDEIDFVIQRQGLQIRGRFALHRIVHHDFSVLLNSDSVDLKLRTVAEKFIRSSCPIIFL